MKFSDVQILTMKNRYLSALAGVIGFAVIGACSLIGGVTPTVPPTLPATLSIPTAPSPGLPGLVIQGTVRLSDGTGLANVTLCRNYSSYAGEPVATTDANGFFRSAFAGIPGDEMVGVWPWLPGYSFEPAWARWRHYYGYELKTLEFIAKPVSVTGTPPAACP